MSEANDSKSAVIIGAGLVGSLCACVLAKKGYNVSVYEKRQDLRTVEIFEGRSINLALSHRGRKALSLVGLENQVLKNAIPMKGRFLHNLNGVKKSVPYDAVLNQCIYSIGRNFLNETLLNAAEESSTLKIFFNHKLVGANFEKGHITLLNTKTQESLHKTADIIIGADGAFSALRRFMLLTPLFEYSQTYIEHGYIELYIPPERGHLMESNHLHIWPRALRCLAVNGSVDIRTLNIKGADGYCGYSFVCCTLVARFRYIAIPMKRTYSTERKEVFHFELMKFGEFMMIALPNQGDSWTVTLFMPFSKFETLTCKQTLLDFFEKTFPDAIPLLGESELVETFFKNKPATLVSIKCSPYHVGDRFLVIGDAAHAMVPFYGQGMNSGFEDCTILNKLLDEYGHNIPKIIETFTDIRKENAYAICNMAMYNYIEMRDLVNRPIYRLRKIFDEKIAKMFPNVWIPMYNSVSFHHMGYKECVENRKWQDKVLKKVLISALVPLFTLVLIIIMSVNH